MNWERLGKMYAERQLCIGPRAPGSHAMAAGRASSRISNTVQQMRRPRQLCTLTLCLLLSGMLCGCAAYRKCGFSGCAGDAAITANVKAQFARYPALTAANSVRIQTLNKVVYLTGQVDTDVERLLAVSLAGDVEGVTEVVDSISVDNLSR
jgi:hypothetical protein